VYVYDTDLGKRRGNDAEVCHFFFRAENFQPGQHAEWWVENGSGADALRGVLTMDSTGAADTGSISLPNGTYKLFWETGADRAKQFTVNCPQATRQPAGAASASTSPAARSAAPSDSRPTSPSSPSPAQASASPSAGAEPSGTPSGGKAVVSGTPDATVTPDPGTSASSGSGGRAEGGLSSLDTGASMAGVALLVVGGVLAIASLLASEVLLRRSWRRR
jgi:hypothetical protein